MCCIKTKTRYENKQKMDKKKNQNYEQEIECLEHKDYMKIFRKLGASCDICDNNTNYRNVFEAYMKKTHPVKPIMPATPGYVLGRQ